MGRQCQVLIHKVNNLRDSEDDKEEICATHSSFANLGQHSIDINVRIFLGSESSLIKSLTKSFYFFAGRRSCLGEILARQEMFLFIAGWIQRFNIEPGTDGMKIDDKPIVESTLSPPPFKIRMFSRDT